MFYNFELGGYDANHAHVENVDENLLFLQLLQEQGFMYMIQHKDTIMLENVATLPKFRGKGLIRQLIAHMQKGLIERGIQSLFVSPITEQVARVYERCGFKTLGTKVKSGHAFRGGKSIDEVRGEV
ncbi:GNAT family N-acetyltransferase [Brevibacillus laterosporus]|uniref:GNAT family N-acetyltransferase n=1 Tax=Brevibacillus laterosporus TaxID=1465 RepID=UPI003D20E404